ncbi:MAG: hypothetical protein DDT40_00939 [candidate division WS2 bacterium]|uniref:Uncharacterized protein n=1 Tax=Psychracetigena formicireducens TaxID=2986056 RepID=A0A9E2BHY5_PSYF1|nr:hypothetical protein [Candidatus Psychracetigena formicireducens]MBT9145384.1 hypothetical protein [Candidatus Psychracetigena formicireducens]MBT9150760.1 hypothetical protein [Candidatus Psychracetigena formicireducens]
MTSSNRLTIILATVSLVISLFTTSISIAFADDYLLPPPPVEDEIQPLDPMRV